MKARIGRGIQRRPQRIPYRENITETEAKKKAYHLLQRQILPLTWAVLDVVATGGVLSYSQLRALTGVSHRTLVRYYKKHLLNRVFAPTLDLSEYGLSNTYPDHLLYGVGPVGAELLRNRDNRERSIPIYTDNSVHLTHDLLCNQVVVELTTSAYRRNWSLVWRSKIDAAIRDANGTVFIEPDALVEYYEGDRLIVRFLVEYHNEQDRNRFALKIQKYEKLYRHGYWRQYWDEMPPVLFAWTHEVGARYLKEAIQEAGALRVRYYGKPLKAMLDPTVPAEKWQNARSGKIVDLFEEEAIHERA